MLKPKQSVQNMLGYSVPMYERDWGFKLDGNENNYGPSPSVIQALSECNYKNVCFYPYYGELSQKIADYTGVAIDNIKVTNGADESIQSIIQTYLEPNEVLLTLDISFEMPAIYTQIQGGRVIRVPFEKKWEFPINSFLAHLDNTNVKIVYLSSPNNPTGNIIEEADLVSILKKSANKVVLIDETYANYWGKSYKEYAKNYDNVFIVRSFSKDFALAGMRLGYVISNEENIKNLKKVVSPYSVNSFALKAGITALSDIEYFEKVRSEVISSKEELKEFFEKLGAIVYDSYANFLLVDFGKKAEFIYTKLRKANITVKLFKKGSKLENHLRVTIPTKNGLALIKEVLAIKPALVFDMDGVLVDATESYRVAILKTYEHFSGKTITPKEIQEAKNLGGLNNDWDLTKYLLEKSGFNIPYDNIVEVFQKFYWDEGKGLINNETALFDKELFIELSKTYNLAIFTGRLKNEAMFALEKFGAVDLFYPIITTDDIPHNSGKPNPYGLNLVKEIMIADNYSYFGDTIDDVKAAKNASYVAFGVLPPQDKSEELKNSLMYTGANNVLKSINEIMEQKNEAMC